MTGGGLSEDGSRWIASREDFFLPVRVLSKVFRGKFLDYQNLDRTNNHVERGNRSFRMLQKTRYQGRRTRTIMSAPELHVLRRWRDHPLHAAGRARPRRLERRRLPERTSQRRAA